MDVVAALRVDAAHVDALDRAGLGALEAGLALERAVLVVEELQAAAELDRDVRRHLGVLDRDRRLEEAAQGEGHALDEAEAGDEAHRPALSRSTITTATAGHEQVEERRRQQPLPGEAHQLVDPDARQGRPHPDEDEHEDVRLGHEPEEADDPVEADEGPAEERRDGQDVEQDEARSPAPAASRSSTSRARTAGRETRVPIDRHERDEEEEPDPEAAPGRGRRSTGNGQSNGAFQPPKKRTTIIAETTNTLTYSAKKKKPKRIPEYSVAKPATISWSASVMSNGVRFASAVAAMKKIRAPSGCCQRYQSRNEPACCSTIELRLIVPARRTTPTTDSVSGIS